MNRNSVRSALGRSPLVLVVAVAALMAAKRPAPTSFEGLVVKVDGASLLLNAAEEKHFKPIAVNTDAKTRVLVDGKPAKLTDLTPGRCVVVSPPAGTAKQIDASQPRTASAVESGVMDGAVVSASEGQVVFLSPMQNGEIRQVSVTVNDKTSVSLDGKPVPVSSLRPDEPAVFMFVGGRVRRIAAQTPESAK